MKAIELIGLEKTYKKSIKALDILDMNVEHGTIMGFVGPNGAGKSTTINIIAGIVKKDKGEVRLLGNKIDSSDHKYKRNVGFVLETPHYIDKLTAREYLRFAATMYGIGAGETERRIDELLDFLDLEGKKKERIESVFCRDEEESISGRGNCAPAANTHARRTPRGYRSSVRKDHQG